MDGGLPPFKGRQAGGKFCRTDPSFGIAPRPRAGRLGDERQLALAGLRRQRRTLRSRKYRQQWFAGEFTKLGFPKPPEPPHDPISLRLRALNGGELKPEELHAALTIHFLLAYPAKVVLPPGIEPGSAA